MSLKDEWKKTGKGLGNAFAGLGKNIGRSALTGVDKVIDDNSEKSDKNDSNVFNDGSWRKTGKDLGQSFLGVGRSVIKSVKAGADHLENTGNNNQQTADSDASENVQVNDEQNS